MYTISEHFSVDYESEVYSPGYEYYEEFCIHIFLFQRSKIIKCIFFFFYAIASNTGILVS